MHVSSLNLKHNEEWIKIRNNDSFNERINKIYALIDPRNDELFYIGCTINPIHIRLYQHLSDCPTTHKRKKERLFEIINDNLFPYVSILYKIEDRYTAKIIERYITNFAYTNDYKLNIMNFYGTNTIVTTNVNDKNT